MALEAIKNPQTLAELGKMFEGRRLSIPRQCDLLSVSRSSLYYRAVEEKPENAKKMTLMDKHLIRHPSEGVVINLTYMTLGLEAVNCLIWEKKLDS